MFDQVKQDWITALRSGNFVQIAEFLTDGGDCPTDASGFCAMGLLTHIVGKTFGVNFWIAATALTPDGFAPLPGPTYTAIMDLNDAGYSFEAIADILESDYDNCLKLKSKQLVAV